MKKIIVLAILSVFSLSAFPQGGITALQYSMGFGTGNIGDFISAASFRGFTLDYRSMVRPTLGVGVDIGWNVFYEDRPYDTYTSGTISYSGKQWRYSNHFPMLAGVDYYMKPDNMINPFVGLGLGTMYSLQNTDMGTYTFEKDAWHFAMRPELGVILNAASGVGAMIAAKYYYGVKAGDLPAQGYFTINVGFVFTP
jgi:outer membrane protein